MIELDEIGELAWLPAALLVALLAWKWRPSPFSGPAAAMRLRAWHVGATSRWISAKAGSALQWVQNVVRADSPVSGNRSFDAYRDETLRRLDEEQHQFRAFQERTHTTRDQSEFDAFMAERAKENDTG